VAVAAGRDTPLRSTARKAVDTLGHGVVTFSSVEDLPNTSAAGGHASAAEAVPDAGAAQGTLPA